MSTLLDIVVTLHCAGALRSQTFARLTDPLPVESKNSGFSELVLVLPRSAVSAVLDFVAQAQRFCVSDSAYKHLQIGILHGSLSNPLPRLMPHEHPIVIEAFETGLSPSRFSEELYEIA